MFQWQGVGIVELLEGRPGQRAGQGSGDVFECGEHVARSFGEQPVVDGVVEGW